MREYWVNVYENIPAYVPDKHPCANDAFYAISMNKKLYCLHVKLKEPKPDFKYEHMEYYEPRLLERSYSQAEV